MATLTVDNFQSKNLLDTTFVPKLGRAPGIVLAKLIELIDEKENIEITHEDFVKSVFGIWKVGTIRASIQTLIKLGLINKKKRYKRELGGCINVYSLNNEEINKLVEGVIE
jgi:hypothetical protein